MEISIGRSATAVVPEIDKYRELNGPFVTLTVIAVHGIATSYTAVGANGRTITLNGYAFSKEFKEICAALGVPCDY